ncbi:CoA transferase [Hoeflea sp. WL0058]|uniref:CoA transferase n=2 Tax=Flavimaribacter sediminis TaxID=2865987 RepID=A0AAE2ZLN3_9HYPH|nr:CoA transferase [Flavimaribacter sediminis]
MKGPLDGIKIVEMAGLGPAPFACYLLAGMGAQVTRIEAARRGSTFIKLTPETNPDILMREIREIDLKSPEGHDEAMRLIEAADVLVEGFRPGVMERLGLGPEPAHKVNPGLIYARMTGYGQDGPMSATAGHDLNYIAMSGVLSLIGRKNAPPTPPLNLVGDYAGGSMMLVTGVLAALFERVRTGRGQVIDAAMVEGSALLATPVFSFIASGMWNVDTRGENLLDSGCPFYDCYETADAKFVAVAPLEPQFFANLVDTLGIDAEWKKAQYDQTRWDELRRLLSYTFAQKQRDEWETIFSGIDACVTPVLSPEEAASHPHNRARNSFTSQNGVMPGPAPKFTS